MEKIDLKKKLSHLYVPSSRFVELIEVPSFNFVMIDGRLNPGESPEISTDFSAAMTALYAISFTLKFMSKLRKENPIDYTVMAVEGLWQFGTGEFETTPSAPWDFTLMMLQPDHISEEMYAAALDQLRKKKDIPALSRVRFEPFIEGLCIQTMHIGPYAAEPATIERMKAYARENSYRYRGLHHEIYLGDPRRSKPEKLRTILRQPVEKIT